MIKKIIASLSLLLVPTICHADGVTPQAPFLSLPTTGVIDLRQNIVDKFNNNFRIISSSIATAIAGGKINLPFPGGATNYIQNGDVRQIGSSMVIDSGTIGLELHSGSGTFTNTVTSTSGFVGNGAGLYNLNLPYSSFSGSKATSSLDMEGFSINNSSGFTLGTNGKITFPDGSTMNTAASGTGGGASTKTITFTSGRFGGLYQSTTAAQAIYSYMNNRDTFNITGVDVIVGGDISTMTALISIVKTTEPITNLNLTSINSTSYTVVENQRINHYGTPDKTTKINAYERAYMFCTIPVSSGTAPSDVQAILWGWFEQNKQP